MVREKNIQIDINEAIKSIQQKHSTNSEYCSIKVQTKIEFNPYTEQQLIENMVNKSYQKSQTDGMLNKQHNESDLKYLIRNRLQSLIGLMRHNGFDTFLSTNIEQRGYDGSLVVPQVVIVNKHNRIQDIISKLKYRGITKVGIYFIAICSQFDPVTFEFYTETILRMHFISDFPKMRRKINEYLDDYKYKQQIKDTPRIHELANQFLKCLKRNGIEIEYTKQCVPCFLDENQKPVIARGYIIPRNFMAIEKMVLEKFVNIGVKKVIISKVEIEPGMLDENLNVFQRFAIWTHVVNYKNWYQIERQKEQLKTMSYELIAGLRHYIPKEFLGMSDQYWERFDQYWKDRR